MIYLISAPARAVLERSNLKYQNTDIPEDPQQLLEPLSDGTSTQNPSISTRSVARYPILSANSPFVSLQEPDLNPARRGAPPFFCNPVSFGERVLEDAKAFAVGFLVSFSAGFFASLAAAAFFVAFAAFSFFFSGNNPKIPDTFKRTGHEIGDHGVAVVDSLAQVQVPSLI